MRRARFLHREYVEALEWRHRRFDAPPLNGAGLTDNSTFRTELELLRLLDQLLDHLEHDWAGVSGVPSHDKVLEELSGRRLNDTRRQLGNIDARVEIAAADLIASLEQPRFLEVLGSRSVTEQMTITIELLDRLTESRAGQEYLDRSVNAEIGVSTDPVPLAHPYRLGQLLDQSPLVANQDLDNGPQLGVDLERFGEVGASIDGAVSDPVWVTRRAVQVHAAFTAQVVPLVALVQLKELNDAGDAVAALTEASLERLYPSEIFATASSTQEVIDAARNHEQHNPGYFPTQEIAAHVGMLLDAADAFAALDRYARGPDGNRNLEDLASGVLHSLQLGSKIMDTYGGLGKTGTFRLKVGTAWVGVAVLVMDVVVTQRLLRTANRTGDTAVARGHLLVLAGGTTTTLASFAIAYGWMAGTGPVGITVLALGTLLVVSGEIVKVTLGKHPFQQMARTCYFGLARANGDRTSLPGFGDPDWAFYDDEGDDLPRQIDGVHSVSRPLGFNAVQRPNDPNRVNWTVTLTQQLPPEQRLPGGFSASAIVPAGPGQSAGTHPPLNELGGGIEQLIETGMLVTAYSNRDRRWIELRVSLPLAGSRLVTLYDYTREPFKPW